MPAKNQGLSENNERQAPMPRAKEIIDETDDDRSIYNQEYTLPNGAGEEKINGNSVVLSFSGSTASFLVL
jgi:hypothetical protein